jgi:hypothetical protein
METLTKTLISFHGDPAIKEKYLKRLEAHKAADEIIQGATGQDGKGCAVWCTLDNYSHSSYENELGIPMMLAKLEDRIFEGLSVEESKDFPIRFLSAIPIGKDLGNIYKHFFIWLLVDEKDGVIKYAKKDSTKKAIQDVADLLQKSLLEKVSSEQFREVRKAAAADAAAYAAAYAAYAAADAAAAYAADAADAAAYAAAAAAYAADAAAAAADAAAYAAAADAAAAAARKKMYSRMADKLIELLQAA